MSRRKLAYIRPTDDGWSIYLPEHKALFGTEWLPLPFTGTAEYDAVKQHILALPASYEAVKIVYEGEEIPDQDVERDQFLHDLFVTAVEGGTNYWAQSSSYRWSKGDGRTADLRDYSVILNDTENGDAEYLVNREVIARGLEALATGKATWGGERMTTKAQAYYSTLDLTDGDEPSWDASTADNIVQAGLFGDVRYG
jgi:hypothetical protein